MMDYLSTVTNDTLYDITRYLDPYSLFQLSCSNKKLKSILYCKYKSILDCFCENKYDPLSLFIKDIFNLSVNKKRYEVINEILSKPYYLLLQWIIKIIEFKSYPIYKYSDVPSILSFLQLDKSYYISIYHFFDVEEYCKTELYYLGKKEYYSFYSEIFETENKKDKYIEYSYQYNNNKEKYDIYIYLNNFNTYYIKLLLKYVERFFETQKILPFDLYNQDNLIHCSIQNNKLLAEIYENKYFSIRESMKLCKKVFDTNQFHYHMNSIELLF